MEDDGSLKKLTFKDVEKMIEEEVDAGVAGAEETLARLERAKDMKKDWRKEITRRVAKIREVVDAYLASKGYQFAFAENLMLKDNDCGLKDSNPFASRDVIGDVYHISPETFEQLMKLDAKVKSGQLDDFLANNLAMNSADMKKFKDGLNHVASDLREKDQKGQLYKDLVVKDHFKPKPREKTPEGYLIYEITNGGFNVRRSIVQGEPAELSDTEVIQYNNDDLVSGNLDRIAVMARLQVGKYAFVKAKVLEGDDQVGQIVYIAAKAIQ